MRAKMMKLENNKANNQLKTNQLNDFALSQQYFERVQWKNKAIFIKCNQNKNLLNKSHEHFSYIFFFKTISNLKKIHFFQKKWNIAFYLCEEKNYFRKK